MGKVAWSKTGTLTTLNGCKGCKQRCIWNGPVTKDNTEIVGSVYGCNSWGKSDEIKVKKL
jgi:hypothetical protein